MDSSSSRKKERIQWTSTTITTMMEVLLFHNLDLFLDPLKALKVHASCCDCHQEHDHPLRLECGDHGDSLEVCLYVSVWMDAIGDTVVGVLVAATSFLLLDRVTV